MQKSLFLKSLIRQMLKFNSAARLEEFLRGILTEAELSEISKRLQIIKLLKAGMPQKEIAVKLGVGIATVTRGSKELQKGKFKDIPT